MADRTCVQCGGPLPPNAHPTRIVCSKACRSERIKQSAAYKASRIGDYSANITPDDDGAHECRQCGQRFTWTSSRPRGGGRPPAFCSARCRNMASNRRHKRKRKTHDDRRRAVKRDAYVEDVDRAAVFERDGYRCHICGKRLWMSRAYPHPESPSIDHLVPLAQGGTHEMANVAAAHLSCNVRKRDGYTDRGDQLLLIG